MLFSASICIYYNLGYMQAEAKLSPFFLLIFILKELFELL